MASTLRFGLLQYGSVQKIFNHCLLCRSLSTKVSNRLDSSSHDPNPTVDQTNAGASDIKPKICFPNDRLKERLNEKFKSSQKRVLTLPNILTFSRMATTPAIGYFIWNGMYTHALTCFTFAATTDLLDGFIARRFNQDSDIGAIIDPVADKLLMSTCFIAMYNVDLVPLWMVKGFVFRDLMLLTFGSVFRYYGFPGTPTWKKYFDLKNYPTIGFTPTLTSKCNTALQCALIVIHLSTNHLVGIPTYDWSIFGLQIFTLCISQFTLAQYAYRAGQEHNFSTKPGRSRG